MNDLMRPDDNQEIKTSTQAEPPRLFYWRTTHYEDPYGRRIVEREPCGRAPRDFVRFLAVVSVTVEIVQGAMPEPVELMVAIPQVKSATEAMQMHDAAVQANAEKAAQEYAQARRQQIKAEYEAYQRSLVVPGR